MLCCHPCRHIPTRTHSSDKAFESACVRTKCIHTFGGHELAKFVISEACRGALSAFIHQVQLHRGLNMQEFLHVPTRSGHMRSCFTLLHSQLQRDQVPLIRHSSLVTIPMWIAHRWLLRRCLQDVDTQRHRHRQTNTHTHRRRGALLMYSARFQHYVIHSGPDQMLGLVVSTR